MLLTTYKPPNAKTKILLYELDTEARLADYGSNTRSVHLALTNDNYDDGYEEDVYCSNVDCNNCIARKSDDGCYEYLRNLVLSNSPHLYAQFPEAFI